MKKLLVLRQMEVYIKNKGQFNVDDLVQEFHISRSTALRYVAALEELGVPIYSEKGRYGGYYVTDSYRIDPVRFSEDEMHAILFALDGVEVLKSSPFKTHFTNISTKLLQVLPKTGYQKYEAIQKHLQIRNTNQIYHAQYLEKILEAILEHVYLSICMQDQEHLVKPLVLWFQSGKWLLAIFDTAVQDLRVVRCDLIENITVSKHIEATLPILPNLDHIHLGNFNDLRQIPKQHCFVLTIRKSGMPLFYSKPFPQMTITEQEDCAVISGPYNDEELDYLLDYCNRFYRYVMNLEPVELKESLVALTKHHLSVLEN